MADNTRRDMKMLGETTSVGGRYRNIKLTGESIFNGDVDCIKLYNTGEVKVMGNLKTEELKITGECEVQGQLEALVVRGRGEVKVSSGVRMENVKFTGNLDAKGDCEAGSIELAGAFNVSGLLSADGLYVKMFGPCMAREIGGTTLRVKRSKATKLLNFFMFKGDSNLNAEQIEGDVVELEHTNAAIVRGNRVIIGQGCQIGRVEYRDSLDIHKSANVKDSIKR
ncbi:bactofilin [Cohnella mopanensis]|uniref:bactofilin n=1 Tax=Cohnella mopanensis TaxID=2911966 RepID=UPI001EF7FD27|nr:bactofilin [Cohnella mopanensis]